MLTLDFKNKLSGVTATDVMCGITAVSASVRQHQVTQSQHWYHRVGAIKGLGDVDRVRVEGRAVPEPGDAGQGNASRWAGKGHLIITDISDSVRGIDKNCGITCIKCAYLGGLPPIFKNPSKNIQEVCIVMYTSNNMHSRSEGKATLTMGVAIASSQGKTSSDDTLVTIPLEPSQWDLCNIIFFNGFGYDHK